MSSYKTTGSSNNNLHRLAGYIVFIAVILAVFDILFNTRMIYFTIAHNQFLYSVSVLMKIVPLKKRFNKINNIENEMIATHEKSKSRGVFNTNAAHYDKYKVLCPGFGQHDELYEDKMRKIGDNSYAFYLEIKDKHKRDWYRAVKGIINLRKTYSDEIIDLACKRALHFGIYSYSRIKKI